MVLGFLRPADQQGAVAVEPGVASLDDPAPGAPARFGSFQLELVAAAVDAGCVNGRLRARRPTGSRSRRPDRESADARPTARAARSGPSRASGLGAWSRGGWHRHAPARSGPLPPRREANVSPPFCSISRIRTGRLATKRRFPGRPVARQPGPVDPDLLVVVEQTMPPNLVKHPGLLPLLKAPVRRRGAADPGRVQRVPLHPRAEHQQDRIHRSPIGHPRPVTAQRVPRPSRQQRLHPSPQPVRHPPTVVARDKTHRSLPRRFQQRGRTSLSHTWSLPSGIGPKSCGHGLHG